MTESLPCWMFHIFGYDQTVFQYLKAHIGVNYLRGYITDDDYLLGYVLLYNEQQNLAEVLGSLLYPWEFDGLLLYLIDEHISNQLQTVSLGNQRLRTELLRESEQFCSGNISILRCEDYLKDLLPVGFHNDIQFALPLR